MMGEMIERAKNILDHYAQKIAERKNAERAYRLDAVALFDAASNAASVLLPPCAMFVLDEHGKTVVTTWERGGIPSYYYDDDGVPRVKR